VAVVVTIPRATSTGVRDHAQSPPTRLGQLEYALNFNFHVFVGRLIHGATNFMSNILP
jgi:hypothetical protein